MTHPKEEKTLIIIKPDAVQRSLVGEVVTRFEKKGLQIVAMKMMHASDALIEEHYSHLVDKPFFPQIKKFMKSAPVVVMVLSGINAIAAVRTIVGPTRSYEASAGTIRGDLSMSMQSNVVHASDSPEAAVAEIARFFKNDELVHYVKNDEMFVYSDELMS